MLNQWLTKMAKPMNCSICNNAAAKRASRRLGHFYDEVLSAGGLRATQYALMEQIARLDAPSLTDLAQALVLDRSALSHTLRPLERDGLIALRSTDDDRRIKRVELTERGHAKLAHCAKLWEQAQALFEAAFGAAEAAALRLQLDQLAALILCAEKARRWDQRTVDFKHPGIGRP